MSSANCGTGNALSSGVRVENKREKTGRICVLCRRAACAVIVSSNNHANTSRFRRARKLAATIANGQELPLHHPSEQQSWSESPFHMMALLVAWNTSFPQGQPAGDSGAPRHLHKPVSVPECMLRNSLRDRSEKETPLIRSHLSRCTADCLPRHSALPWAARRRG